LGIQLIGKERSYQKPACFSLGRLAGKFVYRLRALGSSCLFLVESVSYPGRVCWSHRKMGNVSGSCQLGDPLALVCIAQSDCLFQRTL